MHGLGSLAICRRVRVVCGQAGGCGGEQGALQQSPQVACRIKTTFRQAPANSQVTHGRQQEIRPGVAGTRSGGH